MAPVAWPTSSRHAHPDLVRVVHHPTNLGYGAALRSGFTAARYDLIAFTDGDRQFKVADIGRLTARLAEPDAPDVVLGFRIKRADAAIRIALRADLSPRQSHVLRPPGDRRRRGLQAVPASGPRGRPRSSRTAPSSRPSCSSSCARPGAPSSRSGCRTIHGRPGPRPARGRRSSCEPCVTSGGSGCISG